LGEKKVKLQVSLGSYCRYGITAYQTASYGTRPGKNDFGEEFSDQLLPCLTKLCQFRNQKLLSRRCWRNYGLRYLKVSVPKLEEFLFSLKYTPVQSRIVQEPIEMVG
jgi:hypothetical protein